ncbi:methylated-DNA--[protein]-cysteine S-methyltransferase [Mailhella massiliensis]|uniref:Methylated-DNA--protein-cysteine methyltransferase n=1 Tax=Mailhella massiliensis TaxID=1903261 RepID=A0A921AV78_9BACT|nr:methylated-DNA--[protein]-cysteine S-methyltransferase [Mailhella massiliensis]HJD96427.1 methylated-DNA--[protein]-cysteine S-methyltransferase [Mailhella massiliensis]
MYFIRYLSPVGPLTLTGDEQRLTGLWLDGQKYFQSTLREPLLPDPGSAVLTQARTWLDRYFAGENPSPEELPLAPSGSAFRQLIWKELCRIPFGEVTTYGRLAERAAMLLNRKTMSAQAVGGAVGHNPISIIIPCHRVVGSDGSLTGYAGGLEKKIRLLELEGVDTTSFRIPTRGTAL